MSRANTRLNIIFNHMKTRCYNPKHNRYKDYGAKGITVCDEWNNSEFAHKECRATKGFLAFKKWALSNGYADNLTLYRIDNNKGYSPENCRWVSTVEQANNRRNTLFITYKGKTQSLADWCRELNLNYYTMYTRLHISKWSVEKAFNK